jgi:TrmH family RNA methyltransferase
VAIAMGTEDAGLSDLWLKEADLQVRIPMRGQVNSLNVSVAAALLMYEALRQRNDAIGS